MGMSIHIAFLRKDDKQHKKMVAALKACTDVGVPVPDQVDEYFGGSTDPDVALELRVPEQDYEWADHYRRGYEIDINNLPQGVSKVRFYVSY